MEMQQALKNYEKRFVDHMQALREELESSLRVKRTRAALHDAKTQLSVVEHVTLEDIEREATESFNKK